MEKRLEERIILIEGGAMMNDKNRPIEALIVLPRLRVQNANIISSPLTWGFPSMTAILGFAHALERQLHEMDIAKYSSLKFDGVGVVCHTFEPHTNQPTKYSDHVFCLTRHPLDADGDSPALVQEGRGNMEISLVIKASGDEDLLIKPESEQKLLVKQIAAIAEMLRIAGGSTIPARETKKNNEPQLIVSCNSDDREQKSKKIFISLLPGFALISREDVLSKRTAELQLVNSGATALDTLMEFSSISYECKRNDTNAEKFEWIMRKKAGWIVPIPIGFRAISDLYAPGKVLNARDPHNPFRFVESIYSLGQWVSPHRLNDINDIFWSYSYDADEGLYFCKNNPKTFLSTLNENLL
jgi:CRISPR-associated protein Csy2